MRLEIQKPQSLSRIAVFLLLAVHFLLSAAVCAQEQNDPAWIGFHLRYLYSIDAKVSGTALAGTAQDIWIDRRTEELYIIDFSNQRIVVTKSDGTYLYEFKLNEARLAGVPKAIVASKKGDIYVSDGAGALIVLDYRGMFKRKVDLEGLLGYPFTIQSLYFDVQDEYLYVGGGTDKKGGVFALDKDEKVVFKFRVEFNNVMGLQAYNDEIYFLDPGQFSVLRFDRTGKLLFQFGFVGETRGGFSMLQDMIIDHKGRLAVLDLNRRLVLFFDRNGNYIKSYGGEQTFRSPAALAYLPEKRLLFVADSSGLVRVFRIVEE